MKKKSGFVWITLLLATILVFVFSACKNGEPQNNNCAGELYTLQEAYEEGYLTQDNLNDIANYINNGEVFSELTDDAVVSLIKECAAKRMREREIEPIAEAEAEGFTITGYYGKYSDWYAVRVRDIYDLHPEDVPNRWIEIGGVDFHITNYDMIYCCKFS